MTFAELELLMAIRKCGTFGRDIKTDGERLEYAKRVAMQYADMTQNVVFAFKVDDVLHMQRQMRKNPSTRLKADVAIRFGTRCFWDGRNKGPCDDNAELGHITPRSRGGSDDMSNLMIECRAHNNQRRDMSIEEYIASVASTRVDSVTV